MTRSLKSSKLRQPAQPASATVVTPDAEREAVGIDAVVAGVGLALAGAGVHVHVDVDEPRRHVQPGDVHRLQASAGSIVAATAATLPSTMATSRTA